jgi:hypothetical protein
LTSRALSTPRITSTKVLSSISTVTLTLTQIGPTSGVLETSSPSEVVRTSCTSILSTLVVAVKIAALILSSILSRAFATTSCTTTLTWNSRIKSTSMTS